MSSNRLIYDKCAYAAEIKESTEPLHYNLFAGKYESCKQCTVGDFTNNLPFGPKTDTESELLGLTRPSTKCPSLKFDGTKKFNNVKFSPAIMCQGIYQLTPNNLVRPTTNMLDDKKLGINFCTKH